MRRALAFGDLSVPLLVVAIAAALIAMAPAAAPAEPAVARHVLPNGMTVRESRAAGVVAMSLQLAAGSALETEATAGITNFLHRAMLRGTARRSMLALLEAADELGASVDASGDADHAEVHGQALARHCERLLGRIAEIALEPSFPPDEVERERRVILSEIDSRRDMALPLATDTLLVELYGAHPYAWPATGRRQSIEGLGRDDLVRHYRATYRPQDVTLAVSGDVSREPVLRLAERLFGTWAPRSPRPERQPRAATATGARRVVETPVNQAHVVTGYLGPPLGDSDYASVTVLASLLGGGTGSRFFTEVRDSRGLAYAAGALDPTRLGPSAPIAYVGTAPENVDTVEGLLRGELERVRVVPSADEVARAKARVLGSLAMDRRTNARHAWHRACFELVGVGWAFPHSYTRAVEAVTPAQVTAAAARWLVRPSTVVVRPPRP